MISTFKLASVLVLLGLANAAPAPITPRQNGLEVIRNCYQSGQVALTYDDGVFQYEDDIANTLGDNKATFFLNGQNWGCIYDNYQQVRNLHARGHTLASHTWSHPDLSTLSEGDLHYQFERLEQAFIKILGLKPLYFRPPYGNYNDLVLRVAAQRGYKKMFLWSEDIGDTTGQGSWYAQNVINDVANSYPAPHMVLAHSVVQSTANEVTPNAVGRLTGAGYQLVSVDTCLGDSGEWPYEWVGQPGSPDGSWTCS